MSVRPRLSPRAPAWGRTSTITLALMCALAVPAAAQPKRKAPPPVAADKSGDDAAKQPTSTGAKKKAPATPKEQTFDFNALDLNGRNRTPQLLYFLERANEELERATLEKRSFIPDMVRTMEEENL